MAKELLDGTDVVASFKEVGGEGVAEGVAGCMLGDGCALNGIVECALDDSLVEVVAPGFACGLVGVATGSWEEPLPTELARGGWVFLAEGAGERDVAGTALKVLGVAESYSLELRLKVSAGSVRQQGDAIFAAFALSDDELSLGEVEVFDAELCAL